MPRGAALVDTDGQVALPRNRVGNLAAQQQAARARFRPLADGQFDGIRHAHVMNVDAVARGQHFVNQRAAVLPFGHQHAAITGGV